MAQMIANMAVKILRKLITERFLSRVVVLGLKALSKSSKNTVDDDICKAVGDALGVPCE